MANQKVKATTQEHLDIEDITDDLVMFKSGWVGLVMTTTSVNFDLLSEAEQDATIYAYGAFLNSLTFPMEILIRSKKADITAYFGALSEAEQNQQNPDLKREIQKYRDFLQSIVQQKSVLDKSFYVIINFSPLELGFRGITKKNPGKTKSKLQLLSDSKASLYPRRDHITKQMGRLGLTAKQLTTKELIELFYDIYNPAPTGTQRVILDTASYTVPIVQPAIEVPNEAQIAPTVQTPSTQVPQSIVSNQQPPISLRNAPPPPIPAPIVQKVNPDPQAATLPTPDPIAPSSEVTIPQPQIIAQTSSSADKLLEDLKTATQKATEQINQQQEITIAQTSTLNTLGIQK